MFNTDQNQEQYSCNLKQKYVPTRPEAGESTKPNFTNEAKHKDTKQMRMIKWVGMKYKQDMTKWAGTKVPEDKSYELLLSVIHSVTG